MGFTEALIKSTEGFTIISCEGKRYDPSTLEAKKHGTHCASCHSAGFAESEKKGVWEYE